MIAPIEQQRFAALLTWALKRSSHTSPTHVLTSPASPYEFAESPEAEDPSFDGWGLPSTAAWARAHLEALTIACRPSQALMLLAATYGWAELPTLDPAAAYNLALAHATDNALARNGTRQLYMEDGSSLPIREEIA
jgi:hypothetical protein